MFEEREKFLRRGKRVFVIPEGGSTTLGIWGYINFVDELSRQINMNQISGILTAAGSGGTSAGLLLGTALKKLDLKIYAVNVLYSEGEIKKKILNLAEGCKLQFNLNAEVPKDKLVILDGYSTEGYKNISSDKLKLIKKFAQQTGIILDPAYTGKAFNAFYDYFLFEKSNRKVLFVHTGGIFGVFGKRQQYLNA
jgi:D-cysteine desulfhydrase